MIRTVCFFICFFFLSIPVYSSDWKQIINKEYIDIESVSYDKESSGNRIHLWTKLLNDGKKFKSIEKLTNKKVWYSLNHIYVDCTYKKVNMRDMIIYDVNGDVLTKNTSYEWSNIIPDTRPAVIYEGLCK